MWSLDSTSQTQDLSNIQSGLHLPSDTNYIAYTPSEVKWKQKPTLHNLKKLSKEEEALQDLIITSKTEYEHQLLTDF